MRRKTNKSLINEHTLDIGKFYFYENFIIAEIKENINLNFESGKQLFQLAQDYYKSTIPYVYISNRINSYSVKPTEHYKLENIFPNFKGYAIVTYDDISFEVANLEKLFTNRPTCIFKNLDSAIEWVDQIVLPD
ncbi:hypothetical protein D1816_24290 [Aquimarina sp. AD10]|uniref:STAS/SEC14 domain-containing protein n=1 Tax=Aquimarina aggregata TaxID=1642818 RepID=A0A163A8D6_9FLAO|nr:MULTISPECIES: hypothetical protein [Aquimarina]AXT63328.1 hypothetical protein D1816_24290 [Aquimarina sp. AD10]KZS40340.1 hypothetical protein AWE51_05130 [Aquimarina aggregata]RKN00659.1 hypothetical protein D7033_07405 [Aquimarina sp. AD10]